MAGQLPNIMGTVTQTLNPLQRASGAKIAIAKTLCMGKKKCCKKYKKDRPCKSCPLFR
jgi:hypothetical protein